MQTAFIYTLAATLLSANVAFSAQTVPVSAELRTDETFGWLWIDDATTTLGSKLVNAGEKACADLSLKLKGLDQVKVTVVSGGVSKPRRSSEGGTGLFLRLPSANGSAIAICE